MFHRKQYENSKGCFELFTYVHNSRIRIFIIRFLLSDMEFVSELNSM